jgi:cytochrome c peroxidase
MVFIRMSNFSFSGWLRFPLAVGLLVLAGCTHDSDTQPTPEPATPDPTPYTLVLPTYFPQNPAQPTDNPLTVEGIELGRHLFYEKALSVDNTVACASCHRQELAFTDGLAHALGVNGGRHPRGAMPLHNLLWEEKLTWDGGASSLEQQARKPLESPIEMGQPLGVSVARLQAKPEYVDMFRKAFKSSTITEENLLKAVAQFERTLISNNSRFDKAKRNEILLTDDERRGQQLFTNHPTGNSSTRGGNCGDCHGGNLQTIHEFSNNGLDATLTDLGLGAITGRATDNGKFRQVSLRNIALTAPYMHDGRFATLEAVLDHYNEHIARNSPNLDPLITNATNDPFQQPGSNLGLTATEKLLIIKFLKTLTDSTFIRDPRFAKPTP